MSYLIIVSNRGPFSFSKSMFDDAEAALNSGKQPEDIEFGEGGLVQAMAGLLKPGKWNTTTWLGASMGDMDIDVARGHYSSLFQRMEKEKYAPEHFPNIEIEPDTRMHFRYKAYDFYMRFVFFDTRHMHSYYNRFANGFLWPLMHLTRSPVFYKKASVFPRPSFKKNDFVQYTSSGVTFANTIIDEVRKSKELTREKGDIVVWNQDYHLMRIAEAYKAMFDEEGLSEQERQRIHVGQFIHTPFFNIHEIQGLIREDKRARIKAQIYDPFGENIETVLQKLTWGMLSNDFIGFHVQEYCDHYLEALEEWFPVKIRVNGRSYEIFHQDRVTTIAPFPIGLDVDKILSEVSPHKRLTHRLGKESLYYKLSHDKNEGRYVFGGLERRDYTKGLVERLHIFANTYLELRKSGKEARFYQVTAPSRSDSPDYQHLNEILDQERAKINETLPNSPIIHIDQGISVPQNYRFMKEMDVMLVTPLEDGMNLVAFEYILSQKYKARDQRGMLVLTKSGASRVLKQKGFGDQDGIIFIDALKTKDAGKAISQALLKKRHISDRLITYVECERRVDDWARKNLQAIVNCRKTS
ncbi:MAG: trehalose-6-phosphate synthase [Deltaproteobacteria bacterium]|nr:trehalose-6-phosphate synthase [Deltaproteobacteria bacterium]